MRPSQYTQLCTIARRIVNDVGETDDVAQEAFLAAFLAGHDPDGHLFVTRGS